MQKFDVIIIGSGPGGYVAAIRCAQLGMSTAIVEKEPTLGGTCLNVGCIPSKALLDSSHHYETILHESENHGIHIKGGVTLDFKAMIDRKQSVVDQTVKGIDYLMDKNKVTVLRGMGTFKDAKTLMVKGNQQE
jgi:dihydrolipoamide dehydrogenase